MMSWCGVADCASLTVLTANKSNLLWRNVPPISPTATNYTFLGQLLKNGYDTNANRSYWLLMASSILQVVLWSLSFVPNYKKYDKESHSNYAEFSIAGPEESSGIDPTLDAYGCDENGHDIDGNRC